jgi:hypothetical protein
LRNTLNKSWGDRDIGARNGRAERCPRLRAQLPGAAAILPARRRRMQPKTGDSAAQNARLRPLIAD